MVSTAIDPADNPVHIENLQIDPKENMSIIPREWELCFRLLMCNESPVFQFFDSHQR